MRFALILLCLLGITGAALAVPGADERREKAAALLQAIYDYDVMVIELYDAAGALQHCYTLSHSQAEEVAQVLVPLKAADSPAEAESTPRCLLRIRTIHGTYFSFELHDISPDAGANYCLPLVEYDRLQGVLLELGI